VFLQANLVNVDALIDTPYQQNQPSFRDDNAPNWRLKNGRKKQIWLTDGASNLDELAAKTKI
jgi:hypothetical protein